MNSNELYHYGVLEMKWGVRRYQPYPKGKHGTFLGQSRDDDIKIKKGTEAYRVDSYDKLQGKGIHSGATLFNEDIAKYDPKEYELYKKWNKYVGGKRSRYLEHF